MMDGVQFPMFVSHSQIGVFDPALEEHSNDWTQRHVDQGFSWMPKNVWFRTVEEDGNHIVTLDVQTQDAEPALHFVRVIDVPFEVSTDGIVKVATISDSKAFQLDPGTYQLRFECSQAALSDAFVRLVFMKNMDPSFCLVRADPILDPGPDFPLRT